MNLEQEKNLLRQFLKRSVAERNLDKTVDSLFFRLNNLKNIFSAPLNVLKAIENVGDNTAFAIFSFLSIMDSIEENNLKTLQYDSQEFKRYLINKLDLPKENFFAILLTNKLKVDKIIFLNKGNSFSIKLSFEEIIQKILAYQAKKIILAHNHPKSSPNPSFNDIETTYILNKNLKKFGIKLIDHYIVGEKQILSLKENEIMKNIDKDFETFSELVKRYAE